MAKLADIGSMEDLLASVSKVAAEHEAEVPTSGPDTSPTSTSEGNMTEGARSAEHDAEIKKQLGAMGAEGAPSPDAEKKSPNDYTEATATTTGNDPESESSDNSELSEADPGTALSGATIGDKTANWRKQAEEVLTDMHLVSKQAGQVFTGQAGNYEDNDGQVAGFDPDTCDDPYLLVANGDTKIAGEVRQVVHDQIAGAHLEGEKIASAVITYLDTLAKSAMDGEEGPAEEGGDDYAEEGGDEMPPEMPPEMAGGMPPEAGGMPPEMGGDMGGAPPEMGDEMGGMEADPMVIMEALQEVAAEAGIPIEELLPMLEQAAMEEQGGGMPPEAGGMPPEMAGGMPPEMAGGAPPEEAMAEPKTAADKLSAVKNAIKKQAMAVIHEQLTRGRR